ncbi:MAG: nucleotidyltransferase domain-containing protein, partial [Synergistaceae bacterium]|nr:nucleotidyltransferase domain-containing protein [Synergistaceae bacterium]
DIAPIAKKYGVEKIKLFGSRAKGEEKESSDYDFLISRGEINSFIQYAGFVEELEELLGTRVDVITDTSDDSNFIDTAEKEGILLYANK